MAAAGRDQANAEGDGMTNLATITNLHEWAEQTTGARGMR